MKISALALLLGLAPAAGLAEITPDSIASASYEGGELPDGQSAITAKVQLLLDRADISPGVIDGYRGGMTVSAISAFETREGMVVDGKMDQAVWEALEGAQAGQVTRTHTITAEDLDAVTGENPDDYARMAEQNLLGYVSQAEALAEQFHLDVDFLRQLNPGSGFGAGSTITVLDIQDPAEAEVTDIIIDKRAGRLLALDAQGQIIANYPVAVGSDQTPSPSGAFEVKAVAFDPTYTYQPDVNFQQGDNDEVLTLPPGPNGPVGLVWIDLNEPTYGIHGTPDPARLFSEQSHGCVRMTNWDALELGGMVSDGTKVVFQ
ncbi:MAG: L,D-transpeptidase [Sulfitobacter sp.]|nr:L,D-transpeptidase [Sulfitobacter sp.]